MRHQPMLPSTCGSILVTLNNDGSCPFKHPVWTGFLTASITLSSRRRWWPVIWGKARFIVFSNFREDYWQAHRVGLGMHLIYKQAHQSSAAGFS